MSILPLGETSADAPAREYQNSLNDAAKLPRPLRNAVPHPSLLSSSWFKDFWGPSGICPVQLMGILKSGEFVYFRARGNRVELEVSADGYSEAHARYIQFIMVENHELGTGILPDEICLELISCWLADYFQRCNGSRFSGSAYSIRDEPRSIRL